MLPLSRHHLALPSEADTHYRAVCRALVTEAVELSSFMEKVASSNSQVETDSELGQLDVQDWVRTPICDENQNISTKYLLVLQKVPSEGS